MMQTTTEEVLSIFESTGALLKGHFVLRSGRHSGHFFQCARVCEHLDRVGRLATLLLNKVGTVSFETVVAPAMGGLVIGQEVARQAGARFLFVEKDHNGDLQLRRDFRVAQGERVLIVEDVVTRGGRVQETLDIVSSLGAETVGVALLVDRSEGSASFGVPLFSLVELAFPTWDVGDIPPEIAAIPAVKPGS